jgi:hypothetical protein
MPANARFLAVQMMKNFFMTLRADVGFGLWLLQTPDEYAQMASLMML